MRNFCATIFFILSGSVAVAAQGLDTVFHKQHKKYEATVLKKGYHHLYTVKYNGLVDSVWQWDFGAYMNAKVIDIHIEDNLFITINSTYTDIGYAVYKFENGNWAPLMGGVLLFLKQNMGRIETKIISKNKIQISEEGGRRIIYKLEFTKKTIALLDH